MNTMDSRSLLFSWMLGRQVHQVAEIEAKSHPFPMTRADIRRANKKFSWVTLVAVVASETGKETVVGYISYKKLDGGYLVHRLAVDVHHRGRGIGSSLLFVVENKLGASQRVKVRVPETSVSMQTFLRHRGYVIDFIERGAWEGSMGPRDCYVFMKKGN